jgi:hypothetical protein
MGLTHGGPRDAGAPHKHGSHARRTGRGCTFWVVLEGGSWVSPLALYLPDGTEAIAVFSGEEEARMFCDFLRDEEETNPTIRQTTAGGVLSLLYCPWLAKHVALDPLPGPWGRKFLELLTIDRTRFTRRFVSAGPEPVVRLERGGSDARPLATSPSEN